MTVNYGVNFVFHVSLRGFEVKEFRVFVPMLEPVSLGPLSPPNFFFLKQPIQLLLKLVYEIKLILVRSESPEVLKFSLGGLDSIRHISIGIFTPLVDIIENCLELLVNVPLSMNPSCLNNLGASSVLDPTVLKPFDSGLDMRIIPEISVSSKNKKNMTMIRGVI
jgi:hypothetical protein